MRAIFFILLGLTGLTSCQKEETEPAHIIPNQEVHFKVYARTNANKRIVATLWSVEKGTRTKGKLVGRIDTTTTDSYIDIMMMQNVNPVIYCIASLEVTVLNGYDTMGISIGNEKDYCIFRGGTCAVDYYDIQETFLDLYINKR